VKIATGNDLTILFSQRFVSNVNSKVRLNSSYSTFANDTKLHLRCRPPTRSQPQLSVLTPRWFLCTVDGRNLIQKSQV